MFAGVHPDFNDHNKDSDNRVSHAGRFTHI